MALRLLYLQTHYRQTMNFTWDALEAADTAYKRLKNHILELKEKTGLSAILKHCGDTYLTIYVNKKLVEYMLCHVFFGRNPKGNLISKPRSFSCMWRDIKTVKKNEMIPGFIQIFSALFKKQRFFTELTFHI